MFLLIGGGLTDNIPRVLPKHLKCTLNAHNWEIGCVFGWLAEVGCISEQEMLRTFNCGLGAVLVVGVNDEDNVLKLLEESEEVGYVVGRIGNVVNEETQVNVSSEEAVFFLYTQVV